MELLPVQSQWVGSHFLSIIQAWLMVDIINSWTLMQVFLILCSTVWVYYPHHEGSRWNNFFQFLCYQQMLQATAPPILLELLVLTRHDLGPPNWTLLFAHSMTTVLLSYLWDREMQEPEFVSHLSLKKLLY